MVQLHKITPKVYSSVGTSLPLPRQVSSPIIRSQEIEAQVIADVEEVIEIINDQERKNFKLGAIFLVIAISTWMIGLELVNSVLKGDEFRKPWFLAFLTGSCFMLNFTPEVFNFLRSLVYTPPIENAGLSPPLSASDLAPAAACGLNSEDAQLYGKEESDIDAPIPLTNREIFQLALMISVIYYCYNVFGMLALQYTSASNQTVLGSTTAIFTLFAGVYLRVDRFSFKKLVCVAISLTGVILINVSEDHVGDNEGNKFKPKNPAFGNFLALLGAFCYAMYLLTMKVKCGTGKKTTNERRLFGWVGVCTFVLGIPMLTIVNYLGIEEFKVPPSLTVAAMIGINSVFSVISDYVTILAMLLTSPLVTSLALTSSIPITILIDFILLSFTGSGSGSSSSNLFLYGFGVMSILLSVILINVNISTENELIEEVIEEALEDAIRHDEVLSPVLSPYIGSTNSTGYVPSPKLHGAVGINRITPASLFKRQKKAGGFPLTPAPMSQEDFGFTLTMPKSDTETTPIHNANHHQRLYTIDTSLVSEEHQEPTNANLLVFGGVNHNYYVKTIDTEAKPSTK